MRVAICCEGDSPHEMLRDALLLGGALSGRNHTVHFIAGDPVALVDQAGSWIPSNIHQAPLLKPPPQLVMKRPPVDGLADSMAAAGFDDKRTLLTLASVWHNQLNLVQPDVVVAFGGPVAWLVGPTVAPTLAAGSGMALPPVLGTSFPRLSADSVELADERVMLANANAVLARFGKPSLAALSEVVSNCSTLLYGLPTLDPYLQLRRSITVGALGPMRSPVVPAPEKRVVAFLDAYCPGIETIILALPALQDVRLDIHISRATPGMRRFLEEQPGVEVWADHGELLEQARGARLIVHHGDQDVTQNAIYGGQPQLVFPWTRQQEILTYMIAWMGVMRTQAPTSPIGQISETMRSVLLDSSLHVAAQHHARQFTKVGMPNALPAIIERVERMVSRGA